ncbi:MAG: thermonuclease family protein [Candidatus Omnitrophota bacterium]
MRNKKTLILAIAVMAAAVLFFRAFRCLNSCSDEDVLVSRVIDGDTIELSDGRMVRYIGIDTPELREKEGAGWVYKPSPYAEKARDLNRRFVEGKDVRLELDAQKLDKYNRLLAYVYSEDKMVNLEMVRQGYAMIYTYPPNVKYTERFLEAQQYARDNKKGLWSRLEKNAIAPFEARENIGLIRVVEAEIIDIYLSEKTLALNCRDNFKVVIFSSNFSLFPKEAIRSPDTYFKSKTIRAYGVIKKYKGSDEIIVNDPSQLEVL